VQRSELLDGLQLQQHLVLDDEIRAVRDIQLDAIELQWNRNLLANLQAI